MVFHIISIFPEFKAFDAYLGSSILGRAQKNKLFSVKLWNQRDYSNNKWRKVDDKPYGGGPGMILAAEPILRTVKKIVGKKTAPKVIVFSAQGKPFTNVVARKLAAKKQDIIFVCGRYEGVDARVTKILKAEEYSIGDYILTGGELPAMIAIDAIARHIPGVLGAGESIEETRAASKEIYTRPDVLEWNGKKYRVPALLKAGNHAAIEAWRAKKSTHKK